MTSLKDGDERSTTRHYHLDVAPPSRRAANRLVQMKRGWSRYSALRQASLVKVKVEVRMGVRPISTEILIVYNRKLLASSPSTQLAK